MHVIFLDIDGVLNSDRFFRSQPRFDHVSVTAWEWDEMLDPEACRRLARLVEETGAKVVVSSSWRIHNSTERIKAMIDKAAGCDLPVIGATPQIACVPRGIEVESWLCERDDVEGFVVLDDMGADEFANVAARFVQTEWAHGLQDSHVETACRLLGTA